MTNSPGVHSGLRNRLFERAGREGLGSVHTGRLIGMVGKTIQGWMAK